MSSTLPFPVPTPAPKVTITTPTLGSYIDPSQPPTKRSPWRQIHSIPFIHSATMIMPDEMYQLIYDKINLSLLCSRYAKVILKLEDILTGDFFTTYVKTPGSNVLMLSEGETGVDNRFELQEGVLRMELGKETYERCGLQGRPVRSGGRKHVKARFEVEVDLRRAEMVKGRKGFERVLWAARNVLDKGLVWLFVDLKGGGQGIVEGWYPTWVDVKGVSRVHEGVLAPERWLIQNPGGIVEEQEEWYEIVEWLGLVGLGSERVMAGDSVDNYVSRYTVPDQESANRINLRVIRWHGLLSSAWLTKLLIEVIKQSRIAKAQHWLAMSITNHQTDAVGQIDGYTIVLQPSEAQTEPEEQEEEAIETAKSTQKEQLGGLQRSLCFQFVDSNTAA